MSTTVRHALGDMSSAGTGKLAAALLTSTSGRPNARPRPRRTRRRSGRRRGCRSATVSDRRAERLDAPRGRRRGARPCGWRSRCDAPRRANSVAMALPRPVPPPVTNTHDAVEGAGRQRGGCRAAGGAGQSGERRSVGHVSSPCSAGRGSSARAARSSAMSSDSADERLVDQLVGHRRADLGLGQVADAPAGHLHGDRRRGGDLLGHLARPCRRARRPARPGTRCRGASASSADIGRPVSTRSLTTPWPHIWNRRPTPPVSGITP